MILKMQMGSSSVIQCCNPMINLLFLSARRPLRLEQMTACFKPPPERYTNFYYNAQIPLASRFLQAAEVTAKNKTEAEAMAKASLEAARNKADAARCDVVASVVRCVVAQKM